MTRQCGDHEKLRDYNSEEEEALSLSDLPIKVINDENQQIKNKSLSLEVEDFEFGSLGTSLLTESEICVADDVFFQGQILPLRLSVSSENGLSLGNRLDSRNPSRSGSISESMDRSSSGNYTSRSSSSKSHHSSSTTTTNTTSTTTYKPLKNIFHSHPSPKPQIWNSSSKPRIVRGNRTGKSTTWGLLRVGLVKTPEIELQDLKNRNYRSFNGSFNSSTSSNSSNNGKSKKNKNEEKIEKKKKKKMERKFIFESCKCSVDAVHETVSSKIVVIKSGISKKISINSNSSSISSSGRELLIKKEVKAELESEKGKQKDLNHIRTFEWLKELSISDVPEEA